MPRRSGSSVSPSPARQIRSAGIRDTGLETLVEHDLQKGEHDNRRNNHMQSNKQRKSGVQPTNIASRRSQTNSEDGEGVDAEEEDEAESDDNSDEGDDKEDDEDVLAPPRGSRNRSSSSKTPSLGRRATSVGKSGNFRAAGLGDKNSTDNMSHKGTKRTFSRSQNENGTSVSHGKALPVSSPEGAVRPIKRRATLVSKDGGADAKDLSNDEADQVDEDTSSDDDDYEGVNLISDSEGNEPDLEQEEEQFIIKSAKHVVGSTDGSPSPPSRAQSVSSTESEWGGFELDTELFMGDAPFFEEQFGRTDHVFTTEVDLFGHDLAFDAESPDSVVSRRVRFREDSHSSDSSGSGSDDEDGAFPDLFVQQDQLDPALRLMVENDRDIDYSSVSDGEGSYWDFRGSDELAADNLGEPESSEDDSSDLETDEGDTTDEDLPPPATISRPRFLLRQPSSADEAEKSAPRFRRGSTAQPGPRRIGPSMGSWIADPSKPIAVIDSTGRHMVIIPARRTVTRNGVDVFGLPGSSDSSVTGASPHTIHATTAYGSDDELSDFSNQDIAGSITRSGANLMLGGLLHGAPGSENILGGQVLGPPEAFYPLSGVDLHGQVAQEDDDDQDDEDLWNVQDFIDFGEGSSDSENDDNEDGNDTEVPDTPAASIIAHVGSTPLREENNTPSGGGSAQSMLNHFDRGIVTAFRRNQTRHKLLLSRLQHRESAPGPDSSPHSRGPIKGGSLAAANTPITPLRKRKVAKAASPLDAVAAKRKMMNTKLKRKKAY